MVGKNGIGCLGSFEASYGDVDEPTASTPDLTANPSQHFGNIEFEFVGLWYSMSSIPNDGFIFDDVIIICVPGKSLEFN